MNTKKIVAMVIALIMTTAMFAGCGNNTVDHKDTEVSSTVETTIDKTVEEKSEDKKSETADKTDTTEKANKKDSKETSNKAEKPNDNKVADKSDKDKGSANNSNSSVSKPSTPDKPNKPSGNNSGSSNNGNHNGSVNKPSKPVEKPVEKPSEPSKPVEKPVEKPSEPQKPAPHVHSYQVVSSTKGDCSHAGTVTKKCSCGKTITETGSYGDHNMVHHDAQGHDVTDYEVHAFCGGCGKDFGAGPAGAQAALEHTMMDFNDGCSNYYADEIAVGSHWEETSPAYDECSICGKR